MPGQDVRTHAPRPEVVGLRSRENGISLGGSRNHLLQISTPVFHTSAASFGLQHPVTRFHGITMFTQQAFGLVAISALASACAPELYKRDGHHPAHIYKRQHIANVVEDNRGWTFDQSEEWNTQNEGTYT